MKKLTAKRAIAGLLTVLMLSTLMPTAAFAAEHTHDWTYAPKTKSSITASCANTDGACPSPTVTITLSAPASTVYDGTAKGVSIDGLPQGVTVTPDYYDENDVFLPAAPTEPGVYSASISLGGKTASVEYEITAATVDTVTLAVATPVADAVPQSTVLGAAGYDAAISWEPAHANFHYNTVYTATVTLTAKSGYSFVSTLSVDGWTKGGTADKPVFTKSFAATAKETVTAVTPPSPAAKFTNRYATAADAIADLPATAAISLSGRADTLAIKWSCQNYSTADNAANTFTWSVADALAEKGYVAAAGVDVSNTVTILNADKAVSLDKSVSGFAALEFGKTWADVDFHYVNVYAPSQENVTISGVWEFLGVTASERPATEGLYAARFTPDDTATYAILNYPLELRFLEVPPTLTILTEKDTGKYYPTETVKVTLKACNPYCPDWLLPSDRITVTYQIGSAAAQPLIGDSFVIPESAEGETITITLKTAPISSQYVEQTKTLAFTVNDRSAVNNTAHDATIPYTNTYDVCTLFTLDPNAGPATYTLVNGDTIAKLNGTKLTISGIGTIEIRLDTTPIGIYSADSDTATLTVEKGNGSGTVSISGWTFGQSPNAPTPTSSTNGTAGVTYLYEGVAPTVYAASASVPTKAGTYKVTATFPETALYKSFTASAAFTIGKATPALGTIGCASTLYDTTDPASVVLTRSDTSVEGTLKLIGVTDLEIGTKSYSYEFTPANTNDYLSTTGSVTLTVVKDVAEQLTVSGSLTNSAYTHGDTLIPDGLTLTAVYSSGITLPVDTNDAEVICPTLSAGQTAATIAYRGVTASVTGFTVAKAKLDVSGMGWNVGSYTYTGNEQGPTLTGTLPTGVVATTTGNKQTVAGSYTASVTFSLDANHSADHYEIVGTVADCSWSIAKATVTISDVTGADATYDKTGKAGYTGTPTSAFDGTYTITYQGTGSTVYAQTTDKPVNAGTYSVTFTVPDTDNRYTGSVSVSFTIEKAALTVKADDKQAYVAHTAPTLTYTVTGLYGNDALTTEPVLQSNVDMSVAGDYTITASGADAGSNYTITYENGTLSVTRAQGAGTVTIQGWTYGETPNAPVPSSTTNGTTGVTYQYEGTANDGTTYSSDVPPTLAGSYTVTATFPETKLYAACVSAPVAFTVARATPSYTAPTTISALFGDTLGSLSLPTGFSWGDPESTYVGSAGTSYFQVVFTPEDTDNYSTVSGISVAVSVDALNLASSMILITGTPVYNGQEQACSFHLTKINGQTPTYTVTGDRATDAGTYTLTLTGTGNFTGSVTYDWELEPLDIRDAQITLGNSLVYTGAEQTQTVTSVKINELTATYNVTAGDRATDVGIYYLTVEGTGNFTGSASVRWTIAPDTTKIDPLTPENVTSADRADIEKVLDSIQSVEAKREWKDVVDKCEALLDAIDNSTRTLQDVLDALDRYDIETVKSSDQQPIERLEKEIDYLLKQDNLTDAEQTALQAGADKADALLERIQQVADKMASILDRLSKYDIETVKSSDKADIEGIISEIRALLDGQNLTPDEREKMQEALTFAAALIGRIQAAYDLAHTADIAAAGSITAENVTVADRDPIEAAISDLNTAMATYPGNYTAEERKAMEDELARLQALLDILDKVDAVQDLIDALPDHVEPGDSDAQSKYDAAKDAYDGLSDYEKTLVDTDKLDSLAGLLVAYEIIEGKDSVWTDTDAKDLTFVANGPVNKFSALLIDGAVVDSSAYTAAAPTTTVTLKADFLSTLTEGEHELTVRYTDGEASCSFTTELTESEHDAKKGGWGWILVIILILLFVIGGAIIFFLIYKKKEEESTDPV